MKKILSVFLCAVMLISLLAPVCFAIPLSSGTTLLNKQFKNGEQPGGYDYVYYSPVKGENDSTAYPLLVWLHGKNSGKNKRDQLKYYEFSNWASDEYQALFNNAGGCHLLCVRESKSNENSWDATMCAGLRSTIDYYISLNEKNIDTSRIYIAGYSTGGSMVWEMATKYPDYFAAAMPLAAITQPTVSKLRKLTDMSLWIFTSDIDPYIINETGDVMPNFEYLAAMRTDKDSLRLTSFTEAFYADGTKKTEGGKVADDAEHYIWESVTYDMFMADGVTPYKCATTINADKEKITINSHSESIINWLSLQSREKTENAESAAPLDFWQRIAALFNRLFGFIREMFSGLKIG